MRYFMTWMILLGLTAVSLADEPAKPENRTESKPNLLPAGAVAKPIHILTRQKHFQHFYSITQAEVDNLTSPASVDPHGRYRHWGILGYGSSKPGEGLTKLNRALVTTNGITMATFYVEAPRKLNPRAKVHLFPVWVWEKEQPGLIPVYGISEKDWRNIRFITKRETVKQAIDQAYKTRKVRLKNHGVMFYIMPPKPQAAE